MDPTPETEFTIELRDRGEEVVYARGELEVFLARTFCGGHRLYVSETAEDSLGAPVEVTQRLQLLWHLCCEFAHRHKPLILVVDEADRDRAALEERVADLIACGLKLEVEYDSEAQRRECCDQMFVELIESGSPLSIEGSEIRSVAEYRTWKRASGFAD